MPNLISVKSPAAPAPGGDPMGAMGGMGGMGVMGAVSFIKDGGLNNLVPKPVQRFAGDVMKGIRDARTVASANPLFYIANDLAFPDEMADGTLNKSRVEKGYFGPSF